MHLDWDSALDPRLGGPGEVPGRMEVIKECMQWRADKERLKEIATEKRKKRRSPKQWR